jgi:hypothetical protein
LNPSPEFFNTPVAKPVDNGAKQGSYIPW